MSGSDLCEWSYIAPIWNANAMTYTRDLGRLVGCGFDYDILNSEYLVKCLRAKHYEELVNATASLYRRVRLRVLRRCQPLSCSLVDSRWANY